MITRVLSGAIQGVDVHTVEVEVDAEPLPRLNEEGTPLPARYSMIGLPDAAIRESRERIRSALTVCELQLPRGNTTVNLAPAGLRKTGAIYDLPIALCFSARMGDFEAQQLEQTMVVGELGLNGDVRPIHGAMPLALHARELGLRRIIIPAANTREASTVQGIEVYGVHDVREAVEFLQGKRQMQPAICDINELLRQGVSGVPDFMDVKGQDMAKRAFVIAAAGNHNLLMVGQPGVGKSLISQRIPGIMPPLSLKEAQEVTRIHSIAGLLGPDQGMVVTRPFRSPHHTVSDAGLMGGGTGIPRPGEITLAHRGVLFLDELPEFRRNVLEAMRQPLESGYVTIARASGAFVFPSRFMLVAAMNPCPCGYYGSKDHRCTCSLPSVHAYRGRISGPLLDRLDLHIEVPPLPRKVLTSLRNGPTSAQLREQVMVARERQNHRFAGTGITDNAAIAGIYLDKFCVLDDECRLFMDNALTAKNLSARSYDRILRVARTIADLADRENITAADLAEACQYRCFEQQSNSGMGY